MKKTTLLLCALTMTVASMANDTRLIVERVENHGLVAGNTYRVYAQLAEPQQSLHIVYGDQTNPLLIESTAPFFQHQYCGYSAANMNQAVIDIDPAAKYDSWITMGYDNNVGNDMWDLGVDFSKFDTEGKISANNGGWFLLPTDEKCQQDSRGLVLIAQFTSTGIVSGVMNLQGWNAPQEAWRVNGLTFSTTQAVVFGCTDSKAINFNPQAGFNDGSCEYNGSVQPTKPNDSLLQSASWDVFPNPLRDNMLNIQFNNIDVKQTETRIDIIDMTGKLVGSHSISAGALIGGNRVIIQQELAGGTYKAVLVQKDFQETKTIIVQK